MAIDMMAMGDAGADIDEEGGFHKQLKTKFIDGNAGFMSLVALALVLGLAFCIERIIYLTLSQCVLSGTAPYPPAHGRHRAQHRQLWWSAGSQP